MPVALRCQGLNSMSRIYAPKIDRPGCVNNKLIKEVTEWFEQANPSAARHSYLGR